MYTSLFRLIQICCSRDSWCRLKMFSTETVSTMPWAIVSYRVSISFDELALLKHHCSISVSYGKLR